MSDADNGPDVVYIRRPAVGDEGEGCCDAQSWDTQGAWEAPNKKQGSADEARLPRDPTAGDPSERGLTAQDPASLWLWVRKSGCSSGALNDAGA
jgi:hypothetical protein